MIIRHKILTVLEGVGGLCVGFAAAVDAVGTASVQCSAYINGVNIITSTNLYSLVTSTVPIDCGSGIVVTGYGIENSSYLTIYVDGIDIGDTGIDYNISITHPDNTTYYAAFTNTFKLFGYDLGNNSVASITTNPSMDIYIIARPAGAQSGFARCTLYREPGTSNIYGFNTHSSASKGDEVITYTIDGNPETKIPGTDNILYDPTYTDSAVIIQIATAPGNTCNHNTTYEGRCTTSTWANTYSIDDEDFLDFTFVSIRDCMNYIFTNYSYYPDSKNVNGMDVAVYQYIDGTWTVLTTLAINNLGNGSSSTLTFTEDGTYKLVITFAITGGTCTMADYVFQIGCSTTDCILDKFEDLLCCCRTDTCVDRDYYIYNFSTAILGILWMYRWQCQELIDASNVTPLASTDFAELSEMFEDLFDNTFRFCNPCLNNCNNKVNTELTCF